MESETNNLKLQLKVLRHQLLKIQQEKADLEVMLENASEHSDNQLLEVKQEKADLEVMLENVSEHADLILAEVYEDKQDLELILETSTVHAETVESDLYRRAIIAKQQITEQFQLIAESSPVGLSIGCIATSKFLYANAKTCEILGISFEEILSRKTTDFYVNRADREQIIAALLNQQTFEGEIACVRAQGEHFWAMVSLCPFIFKDEPAILMAMQDVTAQKQAEEALKLAEERYRSIFENALEGIFQTTSTGDYIRVNPSMARIYGYKSPVEMIRQVPSIWAKRFVDPQIQITYEKTLRIKGQLKEFEYQCYCQDGRTIWIEENSRVVKDSLGQVLYYEGIVQEITERKQAEDALKQQIKKLQIEIDQTKRRREVKKIAQTDYFQYLMAEADNLRFSEEDC
ncbi:PAS domain-containing protein [Leptothoe sp. LEGE 181152]|nr:PAS domain-containing protein [Leptothoe sp. LEGE 181152]